MVAKLYKKRIWLAGLILAGFSAAGQRTIPAAYDTAATINYVRIWEALAPDTIASHFHLETSVSRARMSTQYLDGLGRPLQAVVKGASLASDPDYPASLQNARDMVTAQEYDPFGREQFSYLPFAAKSTGGNTSVNDGLFKRNPFAQQAAFYHADSASSPIKGQGETYFYGQSVFEASPLNRPLTGYAPGNSWMGASRGMTTQYAVNTDADSVAVWIAGSGASAVPTTSARFTTGQLYKTTTTDEQGNKTVEYKNKEGQVVLKKVQAVASPGTAHVGWLCTYYIYDDLGRLRFVLPPRAVEIALAASWTISSTVRDELCFYYGYDGLGHMTTKKAPGGGEVYMVYDARDRLVMTQDSNLRAAGKWLVTLYDGLNRPVQTGLVNNSAIGSKSFETHKTDAGLSAAYPFDAASVPGSGYEELTRTGYDSYDDLPSGAPTGTLATTAITSDNFITNYNTIPDLAEQVAASSQTRGASTWTKVKVLGTSSTFLYATSIYDEKGRMIQAKSTNVSGSVDTLTNQYSFSGLLLRSYMAHSKGGTNPQRYYVLTKNTYDGLQRLISVRKRVENNSGSTSVTNLKNFYDALGRLKTKKLGADPAGTNDALETLSYDYNIRGWLLGMNRDYAKSSTATGSHFGFDLGYDKTAIAPAGSASIGSYAAGQYGGNITGTVWKSAGDGQVRKYDFTYDPLSRLTSADFNQYSGSGFDKTAGLDFSVRNLSFDANGNIRTMDQKGWKIGGSVTIDSLAYNYTAASNKLLNVIDRSNDVNTKLGDFRSSSLYMAALGTKTNAATDYTYDGNGNLTRDLNKDISTHDGAAGIEYNYLNLPQKITVKASDATDKGTVEYVYDAGGNKLKKVTTEGSKVTTTLYLFGNYVNDTLQYLPQEEGRIRTTPGDASFNYDYFIKDHLGNVRMVLTDEQKVDGYPAATMEVADSSTQNLFYANLSASRSDLPSGYPTDSYTSPNNKVAKLNGGTGGTKVGPAIVLKVMAGDKFNLRVSDWYKLNGTTPTSPNPITDLTTILANAISGVAGAKGTSGEISSSGVLSPGVTNFFFYQTYNSAKPKAYVSWIAFDEQFKYDSASSGSQQVGADNTLNVHQLSNLPIRKNGFLYIYISNETPNVDVFFDNLQVTHIRGPLIEETHYYPYGLVMAGISSKAAGGVENKVKFTSQLFDDDLGWNTYQMKFRTHDPQIGRFLQIDPLADQYVHNSTYAYAENDVIRAVDVEGLEKFIITGDSRLPNTAIITYDPTPIKELAGRYQVLDTRSGNLYTDAFPEQAMQKNMGGSYVNSEGSLFIAPDTDPALKGGTWDFLPKNPITAPWQINSKDPSFKDVVILGPESEATPMKPEERSIVTTTTTKLSADQSADGDFSKSNGTMTHTFNIPSSSTPAQVGVMTDDGGAYHNRFNVISGGRTLTTINNSGSANVTVPGNSALKVQVTGIPRSGLDIYGINLNITTTTTTTTTVNTIDRSKL